MKPELSAREDHRYATELEVDLPRDLLHPRAVVMEPQHLDEDVAWYRRNGNLLRWNPKLDALAANSPIPGWGDVLQDEFDLADHLLGQDEICHLLSVVPT